ncbi:MAG TPA: hypothetical protein VII66_01270 [Gemmatimonadaceae bacterium]
MVATTIAVASITAGCAGHGRAVKSVSVIVEQAGAPVVPIDAVTPPVMPPFQAGDEATSAQLEHALDEGKAVQREVEWVEHEEAAASGEIAAGEYLVTYLITPADDYYDLEAAQSNFPAHHTTVSPGSAHVAVVVRDAADGRIVQGLNVRATLRSENAGVTRTAILPYGWHPILNRYGENVILPASPFTLSVHIGMPTYRRHDHTNGDRFKGDVIARFAHVAVSGDSLAAAAERLARGDSRESKELAHSEGAAVERSLAEMLHSGRATGSQVRSGDYTVAVAVRRARGYWEARNGKLAYVTPDSNVGPIAHIDVLIRDEATRRFVPGLRVRAMILDSRRREIDTYLMPFMWGPWMNHYGLNVPVPRGGRYTIRVRADAPSFRRYGSTALKEFNHAINVELHNVWLVTAEK